MKKFKREQNSIIIHFAFYLILTIGLSIYLLSNVFPILQELEDEKIKANELVQSIDRIKSSGLTFEEFKKNNTSAGNNKLVSELLSSISKDLYTEELLNKTEVTYDKFLESKNLELNNDDNKALLEGRREKIGKILPLYSDTSVDLDGESLTDYRFINYVESIIETFNLETRDAIGISKLVLLEDFAFSKEDKGSLDSSIYYIPLKLSLKGTKAGIIDFLYFIENVGNITVENDELMVDKNYEFLSKNSVKRVLIGDKISRDYNIFEHQIIDISDISIKEYLDSSYSSRGTKDFKEFILKNQGNEEFEISATLMFFIKGQPLYLIEEFIEEFLAKYKETTTAITKELKRTDLTGVEHLNLDKSNNLLKQFTLDVTNIRKNLSKKEKIEDLYKKVIKIDEIIDPIFNSLKK